MVNERLWLTIESAAGCAAVLAGSTEILMNGLSRLLEMPMKTIEAIVFACRLKTILTNCQRLVIVLCKKFQNDRTPWCLVQAACGMIPGWMLRCERRRPCGVWCTP